MNPDDFFEGLELPSPPPGLREGALRAGKKTMAQQHATALDVWTVLYRNRGLRAAWVTVVVALAAAHLFVPAGRATSASAAPLDPEVASIARVSEVVDCTDTLVRANGLEGEPL